MTMQRGVIKTFIEERCNLSTYISTAVVLCVFYNY